jgi:hypothetical protein
MQPNSITFDTTFFKPPACQVLRDLHTVLALQTDLEALLEEGGWLGSASFSIPTISHGKVTNHGSFVLDEEEVSVSIYKNLITVNGVNCKTIKVDLTEAACFLDQSIKIARLYADASAFANYVYANNELETVSQGWINEQIETQNVGEIYPKGQVSMGGSFHALGKVTIEGKELDVCQVSSLQLTLGGNFDAAQEALHTGDVPAFIMREHNGFRCQHQGEKLIRLPQGTVFALLGTDFDEGSGKCFGTHHILLVGNNFESSQLVLGQLEEKVRLDWSLYEDLIQNPNFKWNWCMKYCQDNRLAPAQSEQWDKSERAYLRLQKRLDSFRDLYDDADGYPEVIRQNAFHALPD